MNGNMPESSAFWTLEDEPTMYTMPYDNRGSRKSFTMEEEKKDTDSVASTYQTESVMSEATERDDQSSLGVDKMDSLLKTLVAGERRGRSRKSKKKTRRKRGESLEREISELIMGIASTTMLDSQVEVEYIPTVTAPDAASVDFILQDLDDPSSLELIHGATSTAPLGRSSGTEVDMDDNLDEPQWQDFGDSHFENLGTTGNVYSTDFDLQLATIAEAVSQRRLARNVAREADFEEYGDPSLEINFSEGMGNDDGTEYEHEPSQPDDELACMSRLSESEFNEGHFSRHDHGPSGSFDSWGWKAANGESTPTRENRSTSPSASTLQERQQQRTKAESEIRDTRKYHGQAPPRERDGSQVERNNTGRSAKSHSRQVPHKDAVIFKTKYEEWSPLITTEFPFEGIRFSDTLVDPDEFERIGSVDDEGYLITQATRPVTKSQVKSTASTSRNMMDPYFERGTMHSAPHHSLYVSDRKYFRPVYPYSPDSVADYPNSGYCSSNRSVDPPGTRDLHLMDDWSQSSTIRIAI